TPHVAGDAPRRGRGPGGRQAPRSGLPRLEAGDAAVVVDGEAPAGAHLAPGVVAVADDETATAVDLLLDVHVAVGGEDLAVGPVGEVPLGTVVGHRRALGEHGREGLAVMVVDSRDEGADGRVAESRGLNRHASQRGPEPDAAPRTPPDRRPPRFGPAARVRRWTGDEPLPRDRRETTRPATTDVIWACCCSGGERAARWPGTARRNCSAGSAGAASRAPATSWRASATTRARPAPRPPGSPRR